MNQRVLSMILALALAGCATERPPTEPAAPATPSRVEAPSAAPDDAAIARTIAAMERSASDRAEDAWRQPATVLSFVQARPGMQVIDVLAAGGYYSELLARAVGPSGKVIAYNNPPYARFAGDQPAQRFGSGRLQNVAVLTAEVTELSLPANSLDAALFVLSYHDLYWRPADGGWERTDPAALLRTLHQALKPGGIVVVQDHAATAGSEPQVTADKLHRIDPERVKQDFAAAGFRLDAESDAFAHADDDLTKLVFDPAIRHRTHQFLYRFKKADGE